jgi:hypothetical protein
MILCVWKSHYLWQADDEVVVMTTLAKSSSRMFQPSNRQLTVPFSDSRIILIVQSVCEE